MVVAKHANACGVAIGNDIGSAYVDANACDPVSAFGGIVAANRTVTVEARVLDPAPVSGHQELYENVVNRHIWTADQQS